MKTARTRLGEGKTDFERRLLHSYQSEGPSADARRKVLAIVGVGSALGASAAASSASATPKVASVLAASLGKWISAGALVVAATGLAAGGYVLVNPPGAATSAVPAVASSATVVAPVARAQTPVATATATATVAPVGAFPTSEIPVAPTVVRPSRTEPARVARPPAPADSLLLGDQVAAIDGAREALSSGEAARALTAVDAYDRSFPNGTLSQEATALRIEALLKLGDRAAAAALADSFLAAHPTSPYASRIRTLLGQYP